MHEFIRILLRLQTDGLAIEEASQEELLEFAVHLQKELTRAGLILFQEPAYSSVKKTWPKEMDSLEKRHNHLQDLKVSPSTERKEIIKIIDVLKDEVDRLVAIAKHIAPTPIVREKVVSLVLNDVTIPLGNYPPEVADLMEKEIQRQIDTVISDHVRRVIVN